MARKRNRKQVPALEAAWKRYSKSIAKQAAETTKRHDLRGVYARDDVTTVTCLGHVDWVTRYIARGEPDSGCPACEPAQGMAS